MTTASPYPYTTNQLAVFDELDELGVGCAVELTNGCYIERESPQRYKIADQTLCFIEACDIAIRGLDGLCAITLRAFQSDRRHHHHDSHQQETLKPWL